MPTIYDLKPKFQQLLLPLVSTLYRIGVTANGVTIAACLASLVYGIWMGISVGTSSLPFLLLPIFMLIRMALNAVDGMLARQFNQKSKLGALLNELTDVISDAALILPFAFLPQVHAWIVLALIFAAVLSEFTGVLGQVIGATRRYDGPLGKSDRAFFFGCLGLFLGLNIPIHRLLDVLFLVMLALLLVTIFNRAKQALKTA